MDIVKYIINIQPLTRGISDHEDLLSGNNYRYCLYCGKNDNQSTLA